METLRQVLVIAGKDLRLEARSKERLTGMLTFAILVGVVFSFALDPSVSELHIGGAVLWVTIIFAGMLGLGRSFALEKEQDALVGILLTPVSRGAIFLGKFLANLVLLLATTAAIYLIYALFLGLPIFSAMGGLALVAVLGCTGFMALGTIFSAMAQHTRMGDTLIPILLIPLLIPVVIFATSATHWLLIGRPFGEIVGNLRMLAAFDLIFLVVCAMIFGAAVEE